MKSILFTLAALTAFSSMAHADIKADLAKVHALTAKKVSGTDVRIKVEAYNNTDHNPCAPEGLSYIAHVYLRKSGFKQLPSGEVGQDRKWEKYNQYYISKEELQKGQDVDDTLCME